MGDGETESAVGCNSRNAETACQAGYHPSVPILKHQMDGHRKSLGAVLL